MTMPAARGGSGGPWPFLADIATFGDATWEIVTAPFGAGTMLVATSRRISRAWAPPGVALTGEDHETIERWRSTLDVLAPDDEDIEVRTLSAVIAEVPEAFAGWAVDATRDALATMEVFARTGEPDAHTAEALRAASTLRFELELAQRPLVPAPVTAPVDPPALDAALRLLSDVDFERLVGTVIREEFSISVRDLAWSHDGDAKT